MTLILAGLTPNFVLQVADRRLVKSNRHTGALELVDDEANKAVVYCGHHVFGYTGLAEIGDEPTDWWIARILAPTKGLREALPMLRVAATDRFTRLPGTRQEKRLAIIGVGWARRDRTAPLSPVLTWVTNCAGPDGWLPEALAEFSIDEAILPDGAVQVVSAGQGITSEQSNELAMVLAESVRSGQGTALAAEVLATAVRDVAARNEAVGRGLLISVLPRKAVPVQLELRLGAPVFSDGQATFVHMPADSADPVFRGPNVVCGGMVHVEPMVSAEPLPPPRRLPRS